MPNPTPDRDEGLLVKEHTRTKEPPMFRVLLHNDDYTTMPFVVYVLQHIFHHSESEPRASCSMCIGRVLG